MKSGTVVVSFTRQPGERAAHFKLAVAQGLRAMLEYWHRTFLPLHFLESAARRYGYKPRKGSGEGPYLKITRVNPATGEIFERMVKNPHYIWRKKREKGHMKPLVWSGATEAAATNPGNFPIESSATRGRGKFVGLPAYFYKFHKGGIDIIGRNYKDAQPDKGRELTTVTDEETRQMLVVGRKRIVQFMQQFQRPTTRSA